MDNSFSESLILIICIIGIFLYSYYGFNWVKNKKWKQ